MEPDVVQLWPVAHLPFIHPSIPCLGSQKTWHQILALLTDDLGQWLNLSEL